MPKFFVTNEQVNNKNIKITGDDIKHIKNVLRKKVGEEIIICNSDTSNDYLCTITKIEKNQIICDIQKKLENDIESNIKVTIMQSLPKKDKMELVIQKTVELGGYEIIPVETKYCVVKLTEQDKQKKLNRWQKISEVAAKQCGRNIIPKVNEIIDLKKVCQLIPQYDIVLLAYEKEQEKTIKEELKKLKNIKKEQLKIAVFIRTRRRNCRRRKRYIRKTWSNSNNIRKSNIKNRNSSIKHVKYNNV